MLAGIWLLGIHLCDPEQNESPSFPSILRPSSPVAVSVSTLGRGMTDLAWAEPASIHTGYFKQYTVEHSTAFCHFSFQIDISSNAEAAASKKTGIYFLTFALKQKEILMWSSDLVIK